MDPTEAQPSTRGSPTRTFIYLIMDVGNDIHALHRIDTSPLFAAGAGRAQHGGQEATRRSASGGRARRRAVAAPQPQPAASATLPPSLARFDCAAGRQFLPLGLGVEKIVSVDRNRHTVIFDTDTESVRAGPDARHVKWHSTWAEAGGRLYHLGRGPGHDDEEVCLDFEALTYDHRRGDWFWNLLPSPPLECYMYLSKIESFADADAGAGAAASAMRISTRHDGTYAFDAARASWRKEGDWALPFNGRAQYVADYGLWFGFAEGGAADLCAADLNTVDGPVLRHVWPNVDGYGNRGGCWLERRSYLSYLGSGRFCVTRFLERRDSDGRRFMTAAVTAMEAKRAAAGEMRMARRASVRYSGPVCHGRWGHCWAY